jgi:hypothetical protein
MKVKKRISHSKMSMIKELKSMTMIERFVTYLVNSHTPEWLERTKGGIL